MWCSRYAGSERRTGLRTLPAITTLRRYPSSGGETTAQPGRTGPFRAGRCHIGRFCPARLNWPHPPLGPLGPLELLELLESLRPLGPLESLQPLRSHWPRSPQERGSKRASPPRVAESLPEAAGDGRWHRDGEVKGWGPPERAARWAGRPADATARTSWSDPPQARPPGRQELRPVKAAFSARPRTRKRSTREYGHAR
jgi:hypothetical protein